MWGRVTTKFPPEVPPDLATGHWISLKKAGLKPCLLFVQILKNKYLCNFEEKIKLLISLLFLLLFS